MQLHLWKNVIHFQNSLFQLLRTLPLAFYLSFSMQAGCKFVSFSGLWRFHWSCWCQDDSDIYYACALCTGA